MAGAVPVITLGQLLSETFRHRFEVAEYRTRKNETYATWSRERCFTYCLEKAFEAVPDKMELGRGRINPGDADRFGPKRK